MDNSPPEIFDSLSFIFKDILRLKIPQLANFLHACVGTPDPIRGVPVIKFGDSENRNYALSSDNKLDKSIQEQLVSPGSDSIMFYVSKIRLYESYSGTENLLLLEAIYENENKDIYRSALILKIIEWAWARSFPFLLSVSVVHLAFLVFLSYILAFPDPPAGTTIILLIFNSIMCLYEAIQFIGAPKMYFQSLWNIVDLIRIGLIYAYAICEIVDSPSYNRSSAESWLVSFSVFFTYIKMISFFRLWSEASK